MFSCIRNLLVCDLAKFRVLDKRILEAVDFFAVC